MSGLDVTFRLPIFDVCEPWQSEVMRFVFEAELWRWKAREGWFFLTVPLDVSDEIRDACGDLRAGFGSVKVSVGIGSSTWKTSIFPESNTGSYVLPIKKVVRTKEGLDAGKSAEVHLEVVGL